MLEHLRPAVVLGQRHRPGGGVRRQVVFAEPRARRDRARDLARVEGRRARARNAAEGRRELRKAARPHHWEEAARARAGLPHPASRPPPRGRSRPRVLLRRSHPRGRSRGRADRIGRAAPPSLRLHRAPSPSEARSGPPCRDRCAAARGRQRRDPAPEPRPRSGRRRHRRSLWTWAPRHRAPPPPRPRHPPRFPRARARATLPAPRAGGSSRPSPRRPLQTAGRERSGNSPRASASRTPHYLLNCQHGVPRSRRPDVASKDSDSAAPARPAIQARPAPGLPRRAS